MPDIGKMKMSVSAPLRMLVIAQFSPRKIWSSGYHGTVYAGVGGGKELESSSLFGKQI